MELEQLVVTLKLNDGDFQNGMDSSITKATAFGSLLGNLASSAVTGAFSLLGQGLGKVNDFLADSVGLASDYSESINAVNVVFEEGASIINEYGKQSAKTVGLSTKDFNKLATVTGAFLTNLGFDSEKAADKTIELTKRAADLGSVFNTDVSQALEAIQSGLKGEFDALEKFGVKMNAASIEAKALEMGLADANGEISDSAKAQAALALIMEQTDKVAGDFTNTSNGLANSQRIIAAEFDNIKTRLGTALLPALESLTIKFRELIDTPEFQKLIDDTVGALEDLGNFITTNLPIWEQDFRNWMNAASEGSVSVSNSWNTHVLPVGEQVVDLYENMNSILERLSPSTEKVAGKFTTLGVVQRLAVGFATAVNGVLLGIERTLATLNSRLETAIRLWDAFWRGYNGGSAGSSAVGSLGGVSTPRPGRASGGNVIAGQSYNVAEFYKPEVFTPAVNGRIDSAKDTKVVVDFDYGLLARMLRTEIAMVTG